MDATVLPKVSFKNWEVDGGLGGSHTAPCGTAVPARPPTHRETSLEMASSALNGPMAPKSRYAGLGTNGVAKLGVAALISR